jgi:hypothetical protein
VNYSIRENGFSQAARRAAALIRINQLCKAQARDDREFATQLKCLNTHSPANAGCKRSDVMRTPLLTLMTLILVASTGAAGAAPIATTSSSQAAESVQAASWSPLTIENSVDLPGHTCDDFTGELRFVLLQLGARASDLKVNSNRYCVLRATFSVLVPDKTGKNVAHAMTGAHWQTVELRTGTVASGKLLTFRDTPTNQLQGSYDRTCGYFVQVTNRILPLFTARDVKLISRAVCDKTGVGLSAQVLMPTDQLAASPHP